MNPGYAVLQIAKVLTTSQHHENPVTRERAQKKIAKWATVLGNILGGAADYGLRAPIGGVPGWATLEVVTGGFATGGLLAGGPLQEHDAADIFIGEFSPKFLEAARRAADLLDRSLYATYYGIDYEDVPKLPDPRSCSRSSRRATTRPAPSAFVQLCASRAGVPLGTLDPATNGMIIEQQQILTTQNLAVLFAGLGLADVLRHQLGDMAKLCFQWVCRRQQVKIADWHARLTMMKLHSMPTIGLPEHAKPASANWSSLI